MFFNKKSKKLKIGLMGLSAWPLPTPPDRISAPQNVLYSLVKRLEEWGHEVMVFSGKDSDSNLKNISADLYSAHHDFGPENENPVAFTERKIELESILCSEAIEKYHKKEIDIIHSHDIRFSPYLFRQAGVPILYTPHFNLYTRNTPYDDYRYKLMNSPLFGVANISKANMKFCSEKGVRNYGYVPNGIDIDKFQFSDGPREGLLVVSRIVPGKIIKEAIDAAEILGEKITIVGPAGVKDSEKEYFEEIKATYFSKPFVNYVGGLPQDELIPYYQKAKVNIYLTASEGFPLGILESMSCGLPSVASNVGGVPDIITDGLDGCLVDPARQTPADVAEKVNIALNINNKLCREKIKKEFTLDKMTDRYVEAYEEFIKEHR